MKRTVQLKKTISKFALPTVILFSLASCSNNPGKEDTKKVAEEHNEAKFENKADEKDAQFLVDAAEISLMEIRLGELAQTNSDNADVKHLGKMMQEDHTKAMNELKGLAPKKQITIPTTISDKGENEYKTLKEKSGRDFDKAYCDKMVEGHKEAISKFEKAGADSKDEEIRNWASVTLPILRKHLDHAINCQKKLEQEKKS